MRSEDLTSLFPCIQAHKSNRACDKIDAAVLKMPQKIVLDEAPRLSIWPAQFKDSQATEDNIALFFFAENLERYTAIIHSLLTFVFIKGLFCLISRFTSSFFSCSYETYESLLKHITANDLALKGYLDGVELLIFSSEVLPPESQREPMTLQSSSSLNMKYHSMYMLLKYGSVDTRRMEQLSVLVGSFQSHKHSIP